MLLSLNSANDRGNVYSKSQGCCTWGVNSPATAATGKMIEHKNEARNRKEQPTDYESGASDPNS
jgi:hypothetical protein